MPVKISGYTSFEEALKQSGELAFEITTQLISNLTPLKVLNLLKAKVLAVAKKQDSDKLTVLLQMIRKQFVTVCIEEFKKKEFQYDHERDRAAEREAAIRFRTYLAELFWQLPDSRREQLYYREQDGSRCEDGHATLQALPATKRFIFQELLPEWTAEPTKQSVHAFRRVIAMGWPLGKDFTYPREGEQEVERKARGRLIDAKERGKYEDDVRQHLDKIAGYGSEGTDKVFSPWLAQKNVPEEIQKILTLARARKGGTELACRDIKNAAVLEGLPESGYVVLKMNADRMRRWCSEVQAVAAAVEDGIAKRWSPHYRRQVVAPHTLDINFSSLTIKFSEHGVEEVTAVFNDAKAALKTARKEGKLQGCHVIIKVRDKDSKFVLSKAQR